MNKTHRSHRIATYISALALIAGCSTTTQVTEVQPVSTGKIAGNVQLHEMDCTPSASSAGVTVNLLGTSHTAVTDSSGNFVLDSVPAGYYTAHFSKPGFGDYYYYDVYGFTGAGTQFLVSAYLSRIRNWTTTLSAASVRRQVFPGEQDSVSFIVSDTPSVVDSDGREPAYTDWASSLFYLAGRTSAISLSDTASWLAHGWQYLSLSGNQFSSGDTVYMIAYIGSCSSGTQQYYSGDTWKTVITGLGPASNVVKLVLP